MYLDILNRVKFSKSIYIQINIEQIYSREIEMQRASSDNLKKTI